MAKKPVKIDKATSTAKDQATRKKAAEVLDTAKKVITTERGNQHGSAENSFEMIANFWMVYLKHKHRHQHQIEIDLQITPGDVAQMMSLLKKARFMYGDSQNIDNFVDDVGYTALARDLTVAPEVDGTIITEPPPREKPKQESKYVAEESPKPTVAKSGSLFDILRAIEETK